jgi:toxin-antitoxin system PIN domain toxin
MPASGATNLLDANVWLALAFSDHQHHASAKSWFDGQAEQSCAFCRVSQMALLRHLTNSRIMGRFVQTQATAWQTCERFLGDPRVAFLVEPPDLDAAFRRLSSADTPSHER